MHVHTQERGDKDARTPNTRRMDARVHTKMQGNIEQKLTNEAGRTDACRKRRPDANACPRHFVTKLYFEDHILLYKFLYWRLCIIISCILPTCA